MQKKLIVVTLVVLVALFTVTPVLAAGPQMGRSEAQGQGVRQPVDPGRRIGKGQQIFALVGTITALDLDARTLVVQVDKSNRTAGLYAGQEVTVYTTETTRILQWTESGGESIGFADLVVGESVSVNGTVVEGQLVARRVTQGAPCVPWSSSCV